MSGTCPTCHLKKRLTVTGMVYRHGDCAGGGRYPIESPEHQLLDNGFTHEEIVDFVKSMQEMRDGDLVPATTKAEEDELRGYRPEMPKLPRLPLRERLRLRWRGFWNNMQDKWDDALDVWPDE